MPKCSLVSPSFSWGSPGEDTPSFRHNLDVLLQATPHDATREERGSSTLIFSLPDALKYIYPNWLHLNLVFQVAQCSDQLN